MKFVILYPESDVPEIVFRKDWKELEKEMEHGEANDGYTVGITKNASVVMMTQPNAYENENQEMMANVFLDDTINVLDGNRVHGTVAFARIDNNDKIQSLEKGDEKLIGDFLMGKIIVNDIRLENRVTKERQKEQVQGLVASNGVVSAVSVTGRESIMNALKLRPYESLHKDEFKKGYVMYYTNKGDASMRTNNGMVAGNVLVLKQGHDGLFINMTQEEKKSVRNEMYNHILQKPREIETSNSKSVSGRTR